MDVRARNRNIEEALRSIKVYQTKFKLEYENDLLMVFRFFEIVWSFIRYD